MNTTYTGPNSWLVNDVVDLADGLTLLPLASGKRHVIKQIFLSVDTADIVITINEGANDKTIAKELLQIKLNIDSSMSIPLFKPIILSTAQALILDSDADSSSVTSLVTFIIEGETI